MSRKTLIIILIVSVGINLGLLGFMGYRAARETRLFHERRPLPHWLGTMEGLTPEQMDRMHAIMTEGKDPMETLRDDLFQKRCELTVLITEQNPDLTAINAKITEISGIQARMELLIVQQIIAIRGVLTPQQQQMLFDYMGRCMAPPPPDPPFDDGSRHGRGMDRRWGRGSEGRNR
jgi:Spy/CpxP family protein refolding chaperone